MKLLLSRLMIGVAFVVLTACSNPHIIAKKDGSMIDSANEPRINYQTGIVEYEDADGRVNLIPLDEISEIKQR